MKAVERLSTLAQLQIDFQNYLLGRESDIVTALAGRSPQRREQGLAIYKKGYYQRLMDVLALDYPVLQRIMGRQRFF